MGLCIRNKNFIAHPLYIMLYISAYCFGAFSYYKTLDTQTTFCTYVQGRCFDITGTVTDIRRIPQSHMRYAITLQLTKMYSSHDLISYDTNHEAIILYCTELKGMRVADTIQIHNVQFRKTANKEFMRYLLKEHIITSAVLNKNQVDLIKRPIYSWSRFLHEYRNKLLHQFRRSMDRETFFAFASIFLGDPFAKKKEETLKGQLKIWGLFHYIARAGLHLVIFVSIWMFILSLLPVSWFLRQLLMIFLCCVYFMLTWPSIPFNRAFFTLLLVRSSGLLRIKTYTVPVLLCIACITLMTCPLALFALDFQLSFGVTFGLAWFNEMRYRRYRFSATIA